MTQTGLIHIYTGDGKGKSTAAVGLAVRCAGSGGNSGGPQLHCDNRAGNWHAENGEGKRYHQKPAGCGKPGLCLGDLL